MRVFICSTCYDLIDLRSELEEFFHKAGVEPILSDSLTSEFQIMPDTNSIETCLANVRKCDEFIIILSNRYGPSLAKVGYEDISATHLEYREAIKSGKKVRMFVRDRLEGDYTIWAHNRKNSDLILSWCKETKDWRIFELLEEHRKLTRERANSNWIYIFKDAPELKRFLVREFKDLIARVTVEKLAENGRIPLFEITGRITDYAKIDKTVGFELYIRNLSQFMAVSPKLEFPGTTTAVLLKSLAGQEQTKTSLRWAYYTPIDLTTKLNYSILEGQKFSDEGHLTINVASELTGTGTISYLLKTRKYEGALPEMMLL